VDDCFLGLPMFNPCILIPVYNHELAIGDVVRAVIELNVPCILVDDGSNSACARVLDQLAAIRAGQVTLLRHETNQGKGRAFLTGLRYAAGAGYTHVLQIDADGQHRIQDIPLFLKHAADDPLALITGYAVYDESVPLIRFYGRYLTHIWVWINTLSLKIKDSMCGFRVYPVQPALALFQRHKIGERMNFDTDILVRLYWSGLEVVNVPTHVGYPADGVSHFRGFHDNVLISRMHATLFFGMLLRLPRLLARKWKTR
jgi:glycosyltransferase involved in cell wall biosynthesis